MGMFNTTNLIKENYVDVIDIPYRSCEESYFLTSLEFCKTINEEFNESNKILYRSLLESGDDIVAINEGFSDFIDKVKEIIKKFIEFLKKLFARFNTALHSIIKSDKYLIKHEKDIREFNEAHEFEMDLYKFTIDPTIPLAIAEDEFSKTFNQIDTLLSDSNFKTLSDSDKVIQLKDKYKFFTDDIEDAYDAFRAKVIKSASSVIYASDYSTELFRLFRDDDDSPNTTTVDSSIVNESILNFKTYDKTLKDVKRQQTDLEKDYRAIEKAIDNMFTSKKSGIDQVISINPYNGTGADYTVRYTDDIKKELNVIAKAQANKVQQLSAIHSMAFAAKLDAITDRYKQDKKILYKALSQIQKYKGKEN